MEILAQTYLYCTYDFRAVLRCEEKLFGFYSSCISSDVRVPHAEKCLNIQILGFLIAGSWIVDLTTLSASLL